MEKIDKPIKTFQTQTIDQNILFTKLNHRKLYTCPICNNVFLTRDKMVEHKKIHKFVKRYECAHCILRFKSKGILQKHLKLVHSCSDQNTCQFCQQTLAENIKDKTYLCDICNINFMRQSDFVEHKKVHKGGKPFQCEISLEQKENLESSNTLFENKDDDLASSNRYSCDICDRIFNKKIEMVEHKKKHKNERHFQCDHCYRGFKTNNILKKHLKIMHSCVDQDTCEFCNKSFSLDKLKTYIMEPKYDFDFKIDPDYINGDVKEVLQEKSLKISLDISVYPKVTDIRKTKVLYFCEKCIITFDTNELYQMHMQIHSSQDITREHKDDLFGGGGKLLILLLIIFWYIGT